MSQITVGNRNDRNVSIAHGNSRTHRIMPALAAFAIYALCVLPFLWNIHFQWTNYLIAAQGPDPLQWLWFFRWWPYALLHGLNPLYSHVIWAPRGENLTWATSTPTLAVALAPITLLWGATAAYNIVALAGPVLAAWCTYLLCREVTEKFWSSLVGGWIFGFSSFEMAELTGRPNLYTTWPLPILVLLVLLRFRGQISRTTFLLFSTIVWILLFGISVEVFASAVIFGILTLLAAIIVAQPASRRFMIQTSIESIGALLFCAVIVSPYLWFMLTDPNRPHGRLIPAELCATDLANLFIPTPTEWLGGARFSTISERLTGVFWEQDAYFGMPLLLMIILYYQEFRKTITGKILLVGGGAALLFSMGPHLQAFNKSLLIPLPQALWSNLPLLHDIWPGRLTVFTFLALAVMVASWLSFSKSRWGTRFLLATFSILFLVPNYAADYWTSKPPRVLFFSSDLYQHFLHRGENIIILPSGIHGYAIPWQAETNFYYNLAGGWLGQAEGIHPYADMTIPNDFHRKWGGADYPRQLVQFIRKHKIGALLVDKDQEESCAALLRPIHFPPVRVGGIVLYRFNPRRLMVKDNAIELLPPGRPSGR